ncbi:hypothetical protein WR25_14114 [Diploscapter pachys]|uniref:Uncharacterized protein n=1 Tax=Diploscapter pachys TaxID=2018661 RepID=A0A2A2JY60_9BILA|nr:hypothetical protein WR25_14114 [Diploscapter pachys]
MPKLPAMAHVAPPPITPAPPRWDSTGGPSDHNLSSTSSTSSAPNGRRAPESPPRLALRPSLPRVHKPRSQYPRKP